VWKRRTKGADVQAPFLIGTHVYLRPLERADAPRIVPWMNDPEITRNLVYRGPINLRAEEEFIDRISPDPHSLTLAVALRENDQLIGGTGLHQIDQRNRHAAFGLFIEKGEWGKGYGTEATSLMVGHAFETLNLNRVWLHVYEYNERGIRAYERVGFRREGVLRQDNYREGRYWDTIVMALLREQWRPSLDHLPEQREK
jgi:RimJ/RimL family protein N-acetyltransferase